MRDPYVGHELDGRYRIVSRVARGGMATVYLGRDERLGRDVALKIMHDHLAENEQFVTRFIREARAAARMSHPNIVQVYDQGADRGVLYLAMEYLPGRTIRDIITERGPFTPREAVAVLDPVLDALASAHRAGIIHRDIKPENIILTDDGRIKVADFGLARAATATTSTTGTLIGSPPYLAPELVTRGVTDTRADVYAAGILLFEMLTGRPPFTGEVPIHVAFQHVHDSIPAPSDLVPGIPTALDDLVAVVTARHPADRPADAGAMLTLLRSVAARLPVESGSPEGSPVGPTGSLTRTGAAVQETRALHPSRHDLRTAARAGSRARALRYVRLALARTRTAAPGRGGHLLPYGALLATALVAVPVWWVQAGPGASTDTPRVVGLSLREAQRRVSAAGLRSRTDPVFSDRVPVGTVAGSRPGPGEGVRDGGTVVLLVSRGSKYVEVPDVSGEPVDTAREHLARAGLRVGTLSHAHIGDVLEGNVISSSPSAMQVVERDAAVDLVISKGPWLVRVPDVVGRGLDRAQSLLEKAGFGVSVEYVTDMAVSAGRVISQTPTQARHTPGATVELVVSQGVPERPVPDVTGLSLAEARTLVEGEGFVLRQQGASLWDTVVRQDPRAGRTAPVGSTVTVFTF